ncbi:ribosomal RNA large subunit methyltransferase G [Agromyces rhizosphaerae]|uniref:Ribosomal RNA large subunit methyltransferase G n=1 Tax=Agromyces rhizosphaerae TaxID=88374 RepID=A0A9W6CWN1_9MICO|nr:class I SAM-dependent methyltransferase [Agromyces rhizosphaerae]GLI27396.1 ribosomal RNA large subunit methyltransferase G [Agromyces rhizosphaerae]
MDFDALRRAPDTEGEGLRAWDAADRLILDEADALLATVGDGEVVVIGDTHGALALGAVDRGARGVRVHQDALLGERAIAANAARAGLADAVRIVALDARLVASARLVLLRLPRSLDALDEIAGVVAGHAADDVVVVAGGRIKHMALAMNDVLRRHFNRLDVSHARQKSRVLIARGPIRPAGPSPWPAHARDAELGLTVVAHGGVFAGSGVDIGTRALLAHLGEVVDASAAEEAIDLACGSGVIAAWLAERMPRARVRALDQSAAAVASARETAAANGVADRVTAERADGLETVPDASARLVVLNPPFHSGAAVTTALAERLFADAGRALAPGGTLVAVWNSHLRYRHALERLVGPTRQLARTPKFTVTASTRP